MTAICDTSVLLAAVDGDEATHHRCAGALTRQTGLVVSPLVLAELDYLVTRRVGRRALEPFFEDLADGVYQVGQIDNDTIAEARELDIRYGDLGLGLTDAVNVVLARDYQTTRILTLDGHYRAVKPLTRHAEFRLLPADL
ncbi:MAG: type II toxin-antitoxin system VapC family toxin [Micromonosporaceae bacterium]